MDLNLAELVDGALSSADSRIKIAAGESEKKDKGDEISMYPASGKKDKDKEKSEKKDKDEKGEKKDKDEKGEEKTSAFNEVLDAASHAMKLAEACDYTARMIPKLSEYSPVDRPGPSVSQAGHMTTRTKHTKETPKTLDKDTATHGGDGGSGTEMKTNKDGGPQKAKAAEFIRHSLAEHRAKTSSRDLLRQYGAKVAEQDHSPSYHKKIALPKGDKPKLQTDPSHPSRVPDNKGLMSLTRRAARTQDTRQGAGKYFSEPAFNAATDKGLQDHFQNTSTAKIAADKVSTAVLIHKLAETMEDPEKSQEERAHAKALKKALEEKKKKEKGNGNQDAA